MNFAAFHAFDDNTLLIARCCPKNTIHFEIEDFYLKNGFKKLDTECDKWQGEFAIEGYDAHIIVTSKSGIGDVVIETKDDSTIIVESKKFSKEKGYSLMREAIGQLMTGSAFGERIKPVVAISYTEKSNELAKKWVSLPQIKNAGITFFLVKDDGTLCIVD